MSDDVDLYKQAKHAAMERLSRLESSAHEARLHLRRKGYSAALAAEVVSELSERQYISDERYAQMFVRDQSRRGKGPLYIRAKLQNKGVRLELSTIKELMEDDAQMTEQSAVAAILAKRFPQGIPDRQQGQKVLQLLVRRGFSFGIAQEAVRQWKGEAPEER